MTIPSAITRVTGGGFNPWNLVGIVVASAAFVAGICTAAVAQISEAPSAHALVPVQLSMGPKVPAGSLAAGKRTSAPGKAHGGLAPGQDKRLAEALNRLSPKERKQLAKAMKRMTPEERKQLTEALKRQFTGKGTAPHAIKRAR
ncbi:MAG: hypothetical protein ABSB15_00900 [Bryobacteraceae bacterium]|jgi:hypothetical protein